MPKATLLHDCQRFADAVQHAGGELPTVLHHLLQAHTLLTRPRTAAAPEAEILDAALSGRLDEKLLDELLPVTAMAALVNQTRGDVGRRAEHVLIGEWHRQLEAGGADQVLDSLRPTFDRHAAAIAEARGLFNSESTAEHAIQSGQPELVTAWNDLPVHVKAIARIAAVAAMFGCRPTAQFPQVREFALGETFKLDDRALMCTAGPLVVDSGLFVQPGGDHRTSPFFRTTLKLHTIAEARARHDVWAAGEHDRIHSGSPGGYIDEDGRVVEHPRPANPYADADASVG